MQILENDLSGIRKKLSKLEKIVQGNTNRDLELSQNIEVRGQP